MPTETLPRILHNSVCYRTLQHAQFAACLDVLGTTYEYLPPWATVRSRKWTLDFACFVGSAGGKSRLVAIGVPGVLEPAAEYIAQFSGCSQTVRDRFPIKFYGERMIVCGTLDNDRRRILRWQCPDWVPSPGWAAVGFGSKAEPAFPFIGPDVIDRVRGMAFEAV